MGNKVLKKEICLIIPAYNEATVIGGVLDAIPKTVETKNGNFPIKVVVVNDGSTDNTPAIVKKSGAVLITHLINSGAGGATRTGLRYARDNGYQYVITMDADGQHSTEDFLKLAESIVQDKSDFIVGSRLINKEGMVWYRTIGNYGLNAITFVLFGVLVTDSQSGLKAMNHKALKHMDFSSSSYAFCSEMIWIAHRHGLKISEIPIKAIYSEYSLGKGQTNWNGFPLVRELVKRRLIGLIDG